MVGELDYDSRGPLKDHSIKSKTARQQLPYRKNPYWHQVHTGLSIGYSVSKNGGEGNWHVRVSCEDGPSQYKCQRIPASIFISNGSKDTKFEQAIDYAKENFELISSGNSSSLKKDISSLAAAYLSHKERLSALSPGKTRRLSSFIKKYIYENDVGRVRIVDFSRQHFEKWIASLFFIELTPGSEAHRRACSTANRYISTMKAILNWAKKSDLVASDSAWTNVEKYKAVDGQRYYLPNKNEFEAVYAHAAETLKTLLVILAETGMRPGEPLKLKCKDFDPTSGRLCVPVDTKTGSRTIVLNRKAIGAISNLVLGKSPDAYILGAGDAPLDSSYMAKLMRKARESAGINNNFVLYSIRHAWITNAIKGSSSSIEVAKYAGTSLQMIEKFYMKYDSKEFINCLEPVF